MGFLDKNTRVVDIILTDCGRELYSKGELDFVYYAFSDDEVDYDPFISNSGSLSLDELRQEKDKQIEATLVREAIFGYSGGNNSLAKDTTNIQNLLFTIPQGQKIVPEVVLSPNIESGSIESKQQKVIERVVNRDFNGDVISVTSESDKGHRKFKAQKLVIDVTIDDFFDKSSRDGFSIKIFESGSSGLVQMNQKRDRRNITSFSNDLQLYKDEEIEKISFQPKESIKKLVE